jgi:hypothetical protein
VTKPTPAELVQKPNSVFYIEGTVRISGKSERIRATYGRREEQACAVLSKPNPLPR